VRVDVLGLRVDRLPATPGLVTHEDLPQARMHEELARRRVYVHTPRWTSLGLSLIEAMMLGLPVVGLAVTEAVTAVPPEAGVLTTRPDELCAAARRFVADPDLGRAAGTAGRAWALERFGIGRFLADWDAVLGDVTA
jgi:glycosyltransferase involved in cell wall biosynthesis